MAEYNLEYVIKYKSEVSLKFSGKDAFSFVDSLISNSISESEKSFHIFWDQMEKSCFGLFVPKQSRISNVSILRSS
ncbi:MAG: hypothetical protein Ct9H90mP17_0810 [Actinomycetota bacterium]|nr:MAG: hypothetical protein Ct9H90mP17_0810 [Actinomycetota bacterium]